MRVWLRYWTDRIGRTYWWAAVCGVFAVEAMSDVARAPEYSGSWWFNLLGVLIFTNWAHRTWHRAGVHRRASIPIQTEPRS